MQRFMSLKWCFSLSFTPVHKLVCNIPNTKSIFLLIISCIEVHSLAYSYLYDEGTFPWYIYEIRGPSGLWRMQVHSKDKGFPGGSKCKESICNAGDLGSIPSSGWSHGEENGLPTPVFSPGEFHGQRSVVGYSPWGHKESDTYSN